MTRSEQLAEELQQQRRRFGRDREELTATARKSWKQEQRTPSGSRRCTKRTI